VITPIERYGWGIPVELLRTVEDEGYPADYLLSRVRGRKVLLIRDWNLLLSDTAPLEYLSTTRYGAVMTDNAPDAVWRYLLREFRWVYFQLNRRLREVFRPFFLYSELKTIFICLRYIEGEKDGRIGSLLSSSVLSEKVKRILQGSRDITAAVKGIEGLFLSLSPGFSGLTETLDREGLKGVEEVMTETFLEHTARSKIDSVLKGFFARIIDSRNVLALCKQLRHEAKGPPPFLEGGSFTKKRFPELSERKDIFAISSLIEKLTGIAIERPDTAAVENALYRGITRFLKKAGREPLGTGPILDYLWKCSLEARNLSLILYGGDISREKIEAEMVR